MDMNLFNYTNHSFGPLYIAAGTECLRDNTECLGGCPDAAYFGLNVAVEQQDDDGGDCGDGGDGNHSSASSHNFETLNAWPTINELHVVTMVNHRVLNASIYGSVALLTSRPSHVDPKHMTRNIRATSVGVTSYDFWMAVNTTTTTTMARRRHYLSRGCSHEIRIIAESSNNSNNNNNNTRNNYHHEDGYSVVL
jgi:hypothetical protein